MMTTLKLMNIIFNNRDEELVVFVDAFAEEGNGDDEEISGSGGCEDDDDNPDGQDGDHDDLFLLPGTNGRPGPMGFNI